MAEKIKSSTYTLDLQTLTPLHIGSGNTLMKGTDYFVDGDRLGKADLRKLYEIIQRLNIGLERWTNYIEDGKDIYEEELKNKGIRLEDISSEIIPVQKRKGKELYEFIRNQLTGNPIIPGSSIKGAIRTALVAPELIENDLKVYFNKTEYDTFEKSVEAFIREMEKVNENEDLEDWQKKSKINKLKKEFSSAVQKAIDKQYAQNRELAYGQSKISNANLDLFKFIRISDIEASHTNLYVDIIYLLNIIKKDLLVIDKKRSPSHELLVLNNPVRGYLQIDERFFQYNKLGIRSFSDFKEKITAHTKSILKKEKQFYKDIDCGRELDCGNILEHLEFIETEMESLAENEFVLRMSKMSGWKFMTGDWADELIKEDEIWFDLVDELLRHKRRETRFPKTRRVTSQLEYPGFVKMKLNEA